MRKSKRLLAMGLAVALCISAWHPGVMAAGKDTKEDALKAYEEILTENPYADMDGGFTAETFNLIDINGDQIPELIVNEEAPNIFTYKDGEVKFLYNSWVKCTMYYSEKSNYLLYHYSWNGEQEFTVYKISKDGQKLDSVKNFSYTEKTKKYYTYDKDKKKKITKKEFNKQMNKYVPKKVKLNTPYENTEASRAEHLK